MKKIMIGIFFFVIFNSTASAFILGSPGSGAALTSLAPFTVSSDGLWHETTIDGYNVWYYGDDTTGNYSTGSSNSGTLTMGFNLSDMTSSWLIFETKYETETSTYYDEMKIMVGSDDLWIRSARQSEEASGNWGWESLELDLSSYDGSSITVSFRFDTRDAVDNDSFGWALYNVNVFGDHNSSQTPVPSTMLLLGLGLIGLAAVGRKK